jgi:hypothetical protein
VAEQKNAKLAKIDMQSLKNIGNKIKRTEMFQKLKTAKKTLKSKERRKRQKEAEALGENVCLSLSALSPLSIPVSLLLLVSDCLVYLLLSRPRPRRPPRPWIT